MIREVKLTTLKAVGVWRRRRLLSLVKHQVKKVASAFAAFFVPKLLQVREQCQDGLDEAHNEHEPILFVHDITPSQARGEPTHRLPKKIYHTFKLFSS